MSEIFCGDCIEVLRTLPDGLVQTCVTSPPYYGLRDYGTAKWEGGDPNCDHKPGSQSRVGKTTLGGGTATAGHEHEGYRSVCGKCGAARVDDQIGLEETPEAYVAKLVEVFREVKRALKDDGTLWLNLGDSYAREGGKTPGVPRHWDGRESDPGGLHNLKPLASEIGLKPKDLIGIPWMVAFALRADGWYLRSDIIWSKPNPMPESVTDRCTKAHEYIFLLAKSQRYYYDADAIAEPAKPDESIRDRDATKLNNTPGRTRMGGLKSNGYATRNRRDVWTVTTKPYKGAHFATFPPDLIEPCIMAGTSAKGECPKCGKAWKRVVETIPLPRNDNRTHSTEDQRVGKTPAPEPVAGGNTSPITKTLGWQPQCECGLDPVPQIVLDPFFGSGTTGAVAIAHGREYIGIDLNQKYIDLAIKRINDVPIPLKGLEEKC